MNHQRRTREKWAAWAREMDEEVRELGYNVRESEDIAGLFELVRCDGTVIDSFTRRSWLTVWLSGYRQAEEDGRKDGEYARARGWVPAEARTLAEIMEDE